MTLFWGYLGNLLLILGTSLLSGFLGRAIPAASWNRLFSSLLLLLILRLLGVLVHARLTRRLLRVAETLLLLVSPPPLLLFLPLAAWGSSRHHAEDGSWTWLPLLAPLVHLFRGTPPLFLLYCVTLYLTFYFLDALLLRYLHTKAHSLQARLDLQEARRREQTLRIEQMMNLRQQEFSVRRETRQAISRELHDLVGHSLSATLMQIAAIRVINQQAELDPLLEDVQEVLDSGLSQIRRTLHGLRAESFDLRAEIEAVTHAWTGVHTILDLPSDLETYPPQLRYDLWAIIREGMTNFMRHSQNPFFRVRLKEHPGFYLLVIEDWAGPDPEPSLDTKLELIPEDAVSPGVGLENIRDICLKYGGYMISEKRQGYFMLRAVLYRLPAEARRSDAAAPGDAEQATEEREKTEDTETTETRENTEDQRRTEG